MYIISDRGSMKRYPENVGNDTSNKTDGVGIEKRSGSGYIGSYGDRSGGSIAASAMEKRPAALDEPNGFMISGGELGGSGAEEKTEWAFNSDFGSPVFSEEDSSDAAFSQTGRSAERNNGGMTSRSIYGQNKPSLQFHRRIRSSSGNSRQSLLGRMSGEERVSKDRVRPHRRNAGKALVAHNEHSAAPLIIIAFFVVGFVSGCTVWQTGDARQRCMDIVNGYLSFSKCSGFVNCFYSGLCQQLPVFCVIIVSAFFIAGYVALHLLLFVRGMGASMVLCSMFSQLSGNMDTAAEYSGFGSAAAAVYIVLSTAVLIAASSDAAKASMNITSCHTARRYAGLLLKMIFYAALLAATAALHAGALVLINR